MKTLVLLGWFLLALGGMSNLLPAQSSISALDVYDCWGRSFDDAAVQHLVARLGKDSTYSDYKNQLIHHFPNGVKIFTSNSEVYAFSFDVNAYQGRLPFELTTATTYQQMVEKFGMPSTRMLTWFHHPLGLICGPDADSTLGLLTIREPHHFCLTRPIHFARVDSILDLRKTVSNADAETRLRKAEVLLWQSLQENDTLLSHIAKTYVEHHEVPLALHTYRIKKRLSQDGYIKLDIQDGSCIYVRENPEHLRRLKQSLPNATLIYEHITPVPGCDKIWPYALTTVVIDGKAYQARQYPDPMKLPQ